MDEKEKGIARGGWGKKRGRERSTEEGGEERRKEGKEKSTRVGLSLSQPRRPARLEVHINYAEDMAP